MAAAVAPIAVRAGSAAAATLATRRAAGGRGGSAGPGRPSRAFCITSASGGTDASSEAKAARTKYQVKQVTAAAKPPSSSR